MSEVLKAVTGIAALIAGQGKKEDKGHVDAKGDKRVAVAAQLDRRKVDRAGDYEGHLMVSIEGSDADFKRTPLCTVLVVDVSGSMGGEKLRLLKETASKIAKNLTDTDEIAIVAFASHVETVLERTSAANKEKVLAAISRLRATTMTNMSGGFMQGLRQVNEKFKGVKRIMLLTDGMANEGIKDHEELVGMVKGRDSSGTLSTFGFGTDCDQELLADMAKAGGGNYYFISEADIKNVFARELGGMLSCIGQNIEVRIRPNKGGEVLEVLNDFTVDDSDGVAVVNAEDLFAGETKHVLVRLRVARPDGKPKARPFSVAHVEVSWDSVKSKKHEKLELNPKVTFVKEKDADEEPVLEVAEQVALIEAANAQIAAVEAAERGDFDGARGILRGTQAAFAGLVDRGSDSVKGLVGTMGASARGFTAQRYTAAYGSTVSNAASNATKFRKAAGDGAEFLSSNVQGTQSMDALEADFTDDDDANLDPPDLGDDMTIDPLPGDYDAAGGQDGWANQNGEALWTDGEGNPLTEIPSIDIPANDAECTGGDWRKCPCASCTARQTLEHIRNRPVPVIRPARPPITSPGFPSPGRPDAAPEKPKLKPCTGGAKCRCEQCMMLAALKLCGGDAATCVCPHHKMMRERQVEAVSKFAKRSRRWK